MEQNTYQVEGHLYVVDKEAKIEYGNHRYCSDEEFGGAWKLVWPSSTCDKCMKIIATTNPALERVDKFDWPVEEDLEDLAGKDFYQNSAESWGSSEYPYWTHGWKYGYKAASKKKYTEEDMRKAWEAGADRQFWSEDYKDGHPVLEGNAPNFNIFIQTLSPIPKWIEFEIDRKANIPSRYNHQPSSDDFKIEVISKKKDNKLIISQLKY